MGIEAPGTSVKRQGHSYQVLLSLFYQFFIQILSFGKKQDNGNPALEGRSEPMRGSAEREFYPHIYTGLPKDHRKGGIPDKKGGRMRAVSDKRLPSRPQSGLCEYQKKHHNFF